jgi:hypothetical protein
VEATATTAPVETATAAMATTTLGECSLWRAGESKRRDPYEENSY